jgi:two-component system LytT family response regulator
MKLRSLIVDDEELARENLRMLLEDHCPEIEVIGTAGNVTIAREMILEQSPDVVFLDIRMPSGAEGFELLDSLTDRKFMVVFVTAFKDYAIKAFNANAIHYVLKPVDIDDLKIATEKLVLATKAFDSNPDNFSEYIATLRNLSETIGNNKPISRIAINHNKGIKIVDDDNIIHLEASGNCTTLYFKDKTKYLDTRTLKIYEEMLDKRKFFRVHKSHIINLNYLKEYLHEDGHTAVMQGDTNIPVSRHRLGEFLQTIKNI